MRLETVDRVGCAMDGARKSRRHSSGLDGSKHGGGESSAGDSRSANAKRGSATGREFQMDDAALQAMARELKRADTVALQEKAQKQPDKQSSVHAASAFNQKVKMATPRVAIDGGSDGGSQAESRARSGRSRRRRHTILPQDRSDDGASERRSIGQGSDRRSSGRGSEHRRDGGSMADSSAPSKSLGLVEVLSETDGLCSRLCIIIQWVPVVLLHGKTLLQIQSFFSLFYLVSIPLELAFSVGSIPCLSEENWRPHTAVNSSAALCDLNNPDGNEVKHRRSRCTGVWACVGLPCEHADVPTCSTRAARACCRRACTC